MKGVGSLPTLVLPGLRLSPSVAYAFLRGSVLLVVLLSTVICYNAHLSLAVLEYLLADSAFCRLCFKLSEGLRVILAFRCALSDHEHVILVGELPGIVLRYPSRYLLLPIIVVI